MTDMTATAEPSAMAASTTAGTAASRLMRKIGKYLVAALVALALIAALAQLVWIRSGSGAWELIGERSGTKLYALKYPGTSLVKYRSVTQYPVPLSSAVLFMQDVEACEDLRCYDAKTLEWVNPQIQYVTFTYGSNTSGALFRYKPREYVVKVETIRDPASNGVIVRYVGEPNRTAVRDCCVRVPLMNNTWRFAPLSDGMLEVEYTIEQFEGGLMPAFYANMKHKQTALRAPSMLPKLLSTEKYMKKYGNRTVQFTH